MLRVVCFLCNVQWIANCIWGVGRRPPALDIWSDFNLLLLPGRFWDLHDPCCYDGFVCSRGAVNWPVPGTLNEWIILTASDPCRNASCWGKQLYVLDVCYWVSLWRGGISIGILRINHMWLFHTFCFLPHTTKTWQIKHLLKGCIYYHNKEEMVSIKLNKV